MNKKNIRNIALGSIFTLTIFGAALHNNIIKLPIEAEMDVQYAADFRDDKILVGASHNVFVGKVIKQVGTKSLGFGPETQFEVEVIHNIKGDLQKKVVLEQFGGYENGILYLVHGGDVLGPDKTGVEKGDPLLKVGSTYVFATRYNASENWHTISIPPFDKKLISENSKLSNSELKVLALKDPRVMQLQEAYKNEVLFDGDVKTNNTRNSYVSTHPVNTNTTKTK